LKCLLGGYGIKTNYDRLREACHTSVDGTSINALEDTLNQLGLAAEQVLLNDEDLFLDATEALPCIVVTQMNGGSKHFVVLWRRIGKWIQVMDPSVGRRWVHQDVLRRELYYHNLISKEGDWRKVAETSSKVLEERLMRLGVRAADSRTLVGLADEDPTWRTHATLDAAIRLSSVLVEARAVKRGTATRELLEALVAQSLASPSLHDVIPTKNWSVLLCSDGETLALKGIVVVRVLGHNRAQPDPRALSVDLRAALETHSKSPYQELLSMLREDGAVAPTVIFVAILAAAVATAVKALFLRSLLGGSTSLPAADQRLLALVVVIGVMLACAALEVIVTDTSLTVGRRLELRFRKRLLFTLPRLEDRYFKSRLLSDLAERGHSIVNIRGVPALGAAITRDVAELVVTALALIMLTPSGWLWVVTSVAVSVTLPFLLHPTLTERELRQRSHAGALSRFYYDVLRGHAVVHAHGAEGAVMVEHERTLSSWARAGRRLVSVSTWNAGISGLVGNLVAVALLAQLMNLDIRGGMAGSLLLVYWSLSIPLLGQSLAGAVQEYPALRNSCLRVTEPLQGPKRPEGAAGDGMYDGQGVTGVSIELRDVAVRVAEETILSDISLMIEAGSHVGVVGASGAGKSTLMSVLLGWQGCGGAVLIDGVRLSPDNLDSLRSVTAWVDPGVTLWNRSLFGNLAYGNEGAVESLADALNDASLSDVVGRLPEGIRSPVGENGAALSGGEGQRIRIGRAFLRQDVRLALLDEPLRGLDRSMRRNVFERVRRRFATSTMLFCSHDISLTMGLDRVLVIDDGRVIEDGAPADLLERSESRYSQLLRAQTEGAGEGWTRWQINEGRVEVTTAQDRPR